MGLKEASLNKNGWQKLPSGLIIQWGTGPSSMEQKANKINKFPIEFPNTCFIIVVSEITGQISSSVAVRRIGVIYDLLSKSSWAARTVSETGFIEEEVFFFAIGY